MFNPIKAVGDVAKSAVDAVRDPGKAANAFKDAVADVAKTPGKALDGVQSALDVAGFVPGVGIVADLANAGISAGRGDMAGAALNAFSAIPGIGDAAKGAKMITKGVGTISDAGKAADTVRALPGHGHIKHGSDTTIAQQTTRVQTGVTPDGLPGPKPSRATRFDSPEAELDAVSRAQARTSGRVANGQQSEATIVSANGEARLPRDSAVVTGHPGGYGSGVQVQRDAAGKPLPGRPVEPTGQDQNAFVVLQREPATGRWEPITQYPTNKPPTP